ncbi:MAG TPA: hypothetical protein PKD53_16650 [Chloroflexaceae bacterium]|nr:hypothetical protein [Chloroflexaceae bacterium]
MPSRFNPVAPAVLRADRATLRALQLIPDYAPPNPNHSAVALNALEAALTEAERNVYRAKVAYEEALARLSRAGRVFHDRIVISRIAVKVQYGPDSLEVRTVGLKRASDRKRPVRREKPTGT